jgi:YD repeat-containing protein
MTECDRWGLRGPVRYCRLQRTWYSRRCGVDACETEERGDISSVDFREDGSLASRWHQNPDGSELTWTYEYNDAGRLVMVRTEDTSGIVDLQRYEYDSGGRLIRLIARAKDGGDRLAESWEYDAAGRKIRTLYIDLAAQRPDTHYGWGVEGTDSSYSAPGATTLRTFHNEREQPTQLLFQDAAGRVLSRVEFVYDGAGHLIEEVQTRAEETLPPGLLAEMNPAQLRTMGTFWGVGEPLRRLHRYDAHGRRSETRSQLVPLHADRKTVVYNDHGDPIEENFEQESRDYNIDDEGRLSDSPTKETVRRSEARFHYEYDARGNWVSKAVASRPGAELEFTLSADERRTLVYFG